MILLTLYLNFDSACSTVTKYSNILLKKIFKLIVFFPLASLTGTIYSETWTWFSWPFFKMYFSKCDLEFFARINQNKTNIFCASKSIFGQKNVKELNIFTVAQSWS